MADTKPSFCPVCEAEPSGDYQLVVHEECKKLEISDEQSRWEHVEDRQYFKSVDDKGRLVGGSVSIRETSWWTDDKGYLTGSSPDGGWTYHLCATRNGDIFGAGRCSKLHSTKEEAVAAALKAMEKQEKRYRKLYPPGSVRGRRWT
jgi:hypothetical protein